jgi:hypothetical protein
MTSLAGGGTALVYATICICEAVCEASLFLESKVPSGLMTGDVQVPFGDLE